METINLKRRIAQGENTTTEFKENFDQEAIETAAAFANTHGGVILIGVSDRGAISGITVGKETLRNLSNRIAQATEPRVVLEIELETKIIFDSSIQESTFIEIDDISEQLNERQRNAFFYVQRHGEIAKGKYMEINRVSHRIAYEELKDMTDKGLLSMVGKGRGTKYVRKVND